MAENDSDPQPEPEPEIDDKPEPTQEPEPEGKQESALAEIVSRLERAETDLIGLASRLDAIDAQLAAAAGDPEPEPGHFWFRRVGRVG